MPMKDNLFSDYLKYIFYVFDAVIFMLHIVGVHLFHCRINKLVMEMPTTSSVLYNNNVTWATFMQNLFNFLVDSLTSRMIS